MKYFSIILSHLELLIIMNDNTLPDDNWLKLLANENIFDEVRFFKHNDITVNKRKEEGIVELIKDRFGSGTKKVQNSVFVESVSDEHERIRTILKKETANDVVALFAKLALISGFGGNEGGALLFRHISTTVRSQFFY